MKYTKRGRVDVRTVTVKDITSLSDQQLDALRVSNPTFLRDLEKAGVQLYNRRRAGTKSALEEHYGKNFEVPQAFRFNYNINKDVESVGDRARISTVVKNLRYVRDFLMSKTSTFGGFEDSMSLLSKQFESNSKADMNYILTHKESAKRFWRILNALDMDTIGSDFKYTSSTEQSSKGFTHKLQQLVLNEIRKNKNWENEMMRPVPDKVDDDRYTQKILSALEDTIAQRYRELQMEQYKKEKKAESRSTYKTKLGRGTRYD